MKKDIFKFHLFMHLPPAVVTPEADLKSVNAIPCDTVPLIVSLNLTLTLVFTLIATLISNAALPTPSYVSDLISPAVLARREGALTLTLTLTPTLTLVVPLVILTQSFPLNLRLNIFLTHLPQHETMSPTSNRPLAYGQDTLALALTLTLTLNLVALSFQYNRFP